MNRKNLLLIVNLTITIIYYFLLEYYFKSNTIEIIHIKHSDFFNGKMTLLFMSILSLILSLVLTKRVNDLLKKMLLFLSNLLFLFGGVLFFIISYNPQEAYNMSSMLLILFKAFIFSNIIFYSLFFIFKKRRINKINSLIVILPFVVFFDKSEDNTYWSLLILISLFILFWILPIHKSSMSD